MKPGIKVKCLYENDNFEGVFKINNKEYSLPNFIKGETAEVNISNDRFSRPYKIKLIEKSKNRVEPKCNIYDKCGSCHMLHVNYQEQLKFKLAYVNRCFKKENIKFVVEDIIQANKKVEYRNKLQVAYKKVDGKIICGFYEEGTHKIIPLSTCLVHSKKQIEIVKQIQKIMGKLRINPYDEDKRTGLIRFVLVKEAFKTNQILVTIVTNSNIFPARNDFVNDLIKECPYITTIVQNVNTRKTSIILGDEEKVLYGKGYIQEILCGYKFIITSKSFFQINPEQTEKLYNKVVEFSDFTPDEKVIDAYCGVGTISIVLSKFVKEVIGVESNKQSVSNAVKNAKENFIKNVHFINEDATKFIEEYAIEKQKIDAVIMDPPRSGSTEVFLKSTIKLKPKKIVYVSCEASTLARDLKLLIPYYEIKKVCLVDIFVGTYHVETVVLLSKKNFSSAMVNIDL